MKKRRYNLRPEQLISLNRYLPEHPELKIIYEFKQDLCRLMLVKKQTARQCRKLIPLFLDYIYRLKDSLLDSMVTLGKTLDSWREEVVRM